MSFQAIVRHGWSGGAGCGNHARHVNVDDIDGAYERFRIGMERQVQLPFDLRAEPVWIATSAQVALPGSNCLAKLHDNLPLSD